MFVFFGFWSVFFFFFFFFFFNKCFFSGFCFFGLLLFLGVSWCFETLLFLCFVDLFCLVSNYCLFRFVSGTTAQKQLQLVSSVAGGLATEVA